MYRHCERSRLSGRACLHAEVRYGTQAWQSDEVVARA